MPTNITTDKPWYTPALGLADILAATGRGVTRGTLGLPGDLESLVRMGIGGKQYLPTSDDWDKRLPPLNPLVDHPSEVHPYDRLGQFYNLPVYGSAINAGVKTIPRAIDTFTRPKVTNSIYSMMPGAPLKDTKYVQRNINGPDEIDDILSSGFMLPKKGGKNQKYFTATNEVNTNSSGKNVVRIDRSKVSTDRAVRARDVELFNRETNTWEPITKKFMGKDVLENPGRREFAKKAGAIGLGSTALAKAFKYLDDLEKATPVAKEIEDVAPAAKAASKYKYNSLAEYNDDLARRAEEEANIGFYERGPGQGSYEDIMDDLIPKYKTHFAKQDEQWYNQMKEFYKNNPNAEPTPYSVEINPKTYEHEVIDWNDAFSPAAKAEMKAYKNARQSAIDEYSPSWSEHLSTGQQNAWIDKWEHLDNYLNDPDIFRKTLAEKHRYFDEPY